PRLPPSSTLFPYTTLFRSIFHCLEVPFEPHLDRMFFFAAVQGQDAVRRNLPGRLGELEIVLVLQSLAFLQLVALGGADLAGLRLDRKSTRLNSSHDQISYA